VIVRVADVGDVAGDGDARRGVEARVAADAVAGAGGDGAEDGGDGARAAVDGAHREVAVVGDEHAAGLGPQAGRQIEARVGGVAVGEAGRVAGAGDGGDGAGGVDARDGVVGERGPHFVAD